MNEGEQMFGAKKNLSTIFLLLMSCFYDGGV